MIINAGIERVVYAGEYADEDSQAFMAQAGVALQRFEWPAGATERGGTEGE
jgi:deoxycytidylate deaminase